MNDRKSGKKMQGFRNPFGAPPEDEEPRCGMFGWQPGFLQLFSSMKVFMFCYVGMGVFSGMQGGYSGAVLPSIERRFGFTSTQFATVGSMSNIAMLCTALFIGHYGGAGHRPRWLAAGNFMLGLAFFVYASPQYFFPYISQQNAILSKSAIRTNNTAAYEEMCTPDFAKNSSLDGSTVVCTAAEIEVADRRTTNPLIVFGVADFLMGLGGATTTVLGLTFVDDNVPYGSTPLYFTLSFVGRLLGPLLGAGLASLVNNIYLNLSVPTFPPTDPRWISAWYLGFIVCGLGVCFFSFLIGCFPAVLPRGKKLSISGEPEKPSKNSNNHHGKPKQPAVKLVDLPKNLKRLLLNSTYMIKLASQLMLGMALAGYSGFSQKFIQNQYDLSPSLASLVGGMPPIFSLFLGIALGSLLIRRFKFLPRDVSMMTVAAALGCACCYFSVIAMGCEAPIVVGLPATTTISRIIPQSQTCGVENKCACHTNQLTPVCHLASKVSYVSPCFAGCTSITYQNQTKIYGGCTCLAGATGNATLQSDSLQDVSPDDVVVPNLCPTTCNYVPYIVVMCLAKLFMGIPLSGVLMVQFRIVDFDLKSLANAVSTIVMGTLGFLPAPIIAGYIIDSTCRFWQTSACGTHGACLLYDVDGFRVKLHATVGSVQLLAACLDLLVTFKLWHIKFDREEVEKQAVTATLTTTAMPPVTYHAQPRTGPHPNGSTSTSPIPHFDAENVVSITGSANATTGVRRRSSTTA